MPYEYEGASKELVLAANVTAFPGPTTDPTLDATLTQRIALDRVVVTQPGADGSLITLSGHTTTSISGASWDAGTLTLTLAGAFAGYTLVPGDTFVVISGTGATPGTYVVASSVAPDAITLTASPGANAVDYVGVLHRSQGTVLTASFVTGGLVPTTMDFGPNGIFTDWIGLRAVSSDGASQPEAVITYRTY